MGSGCLISNQEQKLLLLKPTYKTTWEIPGGIVEENESPLTCCKREVQEELSLDIHIGPLLVVDYNTYPSEPEKTESLMFIFDGGVMPDAQIKDIVINKKEHQDFGFFTKNELAQRLDKNLLERTLLAWKQREEGKVVYSENQKEIT